MSPTWLRLSVPPLGLLAFALGLAERLWAEPYFKKHTSGIATVTALCVLVGAMVVPLAIFALLHGRRWRRPAGFEVREARFVAPLRAGGYDGFMAIFFMGMGASLMTEIAADGDSIQFVHARFLLVISLLMVTVFFALSVARAAITLPQVHLDPNGLTIRRIPNTHVAWDAMAPGGPPPPARGWFGELRIYLNAPPQVGGMPSHVDIPIWRLHVNPAFLAAAIRHYVEHPENRAAIGTPEELTRLQAAFATAGAAASWSSAAGNGR